MKAKRIAEVRALLASSAFQDWFLRYSELREELTLCTERYDDLLAQANMLSFKVDTTQRRADEKVFRAGEFEDLSAAAHAEFAQIENDSYEALSDFEMRRQAVSEYWVTLGQAEQRLEGERQRVSEVRAKLEASRKEGHGSTNSEDAAHLASLEARVEGLAREAEQARQRLRLHETSRDEMWKLVEEAWSSSFRANMARYELAYRARRTRGEAEKLFMRATRERVRAAELELEANQLQQDLHRLTEHFQAHLRSGASQFECALIEEFLYWPQQDDVSVAICVPLIEEPRYLNIQVVPLEMYQVQRSRGLELVEPLPDVETAGDDDPRLDAFFARAAAGG